MFGFGRKMLVLGTVALVAASGAAAAADPQHAQDPGKNFNYVIKDGKPVPKGNRVTNKDGSWREEVRQGNCTTVKERTADGEIKTSSQCSAPN